MTLSFIMVIALIVGLINCWDYINIVGLASLIKKKSLELLLALTLIDLGKGILLYYYIINNSNLNYYVILTGFIIFLCNSIKYYTSKSAGYYLSLLGFIWPLYGQAINTIFILAIILFYLTKNITYTKKIILVLIPVTILLVVESGEIFLISLLLISTTLHVYPRGGAKNLT